MRTGAKIGLVFWDQISDNYNYQQLANNWALLEYHDHTPGRGVPVGPGGLATGAVLAASIASGVIGTQHLNFTPGRIGSWTSIVPNLASGVVGVGGYYTPSVRLEGNGDIVRFKGSVQNTSGGTLTSGSTILTLPTGFRPASTVALNSNVGGTACWVYIAPSGVMTLSQSAANTQSLILDGLTFTLS